MTTTIFTADELTAKTGKQLLELLNADFNYQHSKRLKDTKKADLVAKYLELQSEAQAQAVEAAAVDTAQEIESQEVEIELEASKGHLGFYDGFEFFYRDSDVVKASVSNFVAPDGYRVGRWECTISHLLQFRDQYSFLDLTELLNFADLAEADELEAKRIEDEEAEAERRYQEELEAAEDEGSDEEEDTNSQRSDAELSDAIMAVLVTGKRKFADIAKKLEIERDHALALLLQLEYDGKVTQIKSSGVFKLAEVVAEVKSEPKDEVAAKRMNKAQNADDKLNRELAAGVSAIAQKHDVKAKAKKTRKPFDQAPAATLKPVKAGSKQAILIERLLTGATIEQLVSATGWQKASVKSAFSYDLKSKGYGVRQDGDRFYLVLPATATEPLFTDVVAKGMGRDVDLEAARKSA